MTLKIKKYCNVKSCSIHTKLKDILHQKNETVNDYAKNKGFNIFTYYYDIGINDTTPYIYINNELYIKELRNFMNDRCKMLNNFLKLNRNIKRYQNIVKTFSKHHNICYDIQTIVLSFLIEFEPVERANRWYENDKNFCNFLYSYRL